MLRCAELGFTSAADLDALDMGEIYDMLIERNNDQAEYHIKATQADIDAFWG